DVADIVRRSQQTEAADEILLRPLLHLAAANVGVAAAQRGVNLLQAQSVVAQASQVGIHFVGFYQTADAHDVGDAGNHAQVALDHPVFERAQVARAEAVSFDDKCTDAYVRQQVSERSQTANRNRGL